MPLSKLNYVHLEGGRFNAKTETSARDLDVLLDEIIQKPPAHGLLLHFHGGLVSMKSGKQIAEKLVNRFGPETHVVGFVWESGPFETMRNNLGEIAKEEFFQRLLAKVIVWALKRWTPGLDGLKGVEEGGWRGVGSSGVVNEPVVEAEVRTWLETGVSPDGRPPYEALEGEETVGDVEVAEEPSAPDPEIQIDIEADGGIQAALGRISNGQLPNPEVASSKGGFVRGSDATLMDEESLAKLREPASPGEKGFLSTLKLAYYATKIVYRVVRRMAKGRGHGLYTTAVEEVLREFYLGPAGKAFLWDRMKQDTQDAFGLDPDVCGGTELLKRLAKRRKEGVALPRITLTGHSTGAIYICHFLEAASQWVPDLKFDVVFLAPAVSCELFGEILARHRSRIGHFRSFGMSDELERHDRLVPILYPRSLLYFVSGVVESDDGADVPLVGMSRFHSGKPPYAGTKVPGVDATREFFAGAGGASQGVWSSALGTPGLESQAAKHGAFDDDSKTLESLAYILSNGY